MLFMQDNRTIKPVDLKYKLHQGMYHYTIQARIDDTHKTAAKNFLKGFQERNGEGKGWGDVALTLIGKAPPDFNTEWATRYLKEHEENLGDEGYKAYCESSMTKKLEITLAKDVIKQAEIQKDLEKTTKQVNENRLKAQEAWYKDSQKCPKNG
jgi:hypothetical protein